MTDAGTSHRLVVLTAAGPEHRYVVNRLASELPIHSVVVDVQERRPSLRRAFRGSFFGGLSRLGLFVFRRLVRDAGKRSAAFERLLGSPTAPIELPPVTYVQGVNSDEALAAVAAAAPDVLLIFGTSLVGQKMLAIPERMALNLHTGISPQYRGTDCSFWPVANREPEWLGATVHECTLDIDGGKIFGTTRAIWQPDDDLHELFIRAVICGADLYVDVVKQYLDDRILRGTPQNLATGREFRGYMRTLGPELKARLALRRGLLGPQ